MQRQHNGPRTAGKWVGIYPTQGDVHIVVRHRLFTKRGETNHRNREKRGQSIESYGHDPHHIRDVNYIWIENFQKSTDSIKRRVAGTGVVLAPLTWDTRFSWMSAPTKSRRCCRAVSSRCAARQNAYRCSRHWFNWTTSTGLSRSKCTAIQGLVCGKNVGEIRVITWQIQSLICGLQSTLLSKWIKWEDWCFQFRCLILIWDTLRLDFPIKLESPTAS